MAGSDLVPVTVMQRTDGSANPLEQRVDWFFVARRWGGRPRIREPDSCAPLAWYPLRDLPMPMPDCERQVLDGLAAGRLAAFTSYGF